MILIGEYLIRRVIIVVVVIFPWVHISGMIECVHNYLIPVDDIYREITLERNRY